MRNHRQKRRLHIAIAACLLALPLTLSAASSITGYIANDTNARPSSEQFTQSLIQVLRKISGNPNVDSIGSLQQTIQNPKDLVRNFSRQQETGPDGSSTSVLEINFSAKEIYNALRASNQNIWPLTSRPRVLVVLRVNDNALIGSDADNQIKDTIDWQSKILGIPVLWPLADLDDTQAMQQSTGNALRALKRRYNVQNILMATVTDNSVVWSSNMEGSSNSWRSSTSSGWVHTGLMRFLDVFSDNYATANAYNQALNITININNINGFADLAHATKCIKQNSLLSNVQITQNNIDSVSMSATLIDMHDFINTLKDQNKNCSFSTYKIYHTANADSTDSTPNTVALKWSGDNS